MISAFRNFSRGERNLRESRWKSDISSSLARDLTGKTLAILGLGGIGFRLAELAHGFPMRVIYHSRTKVEGAPDWCEYFGQEQLDEFLGLADVLSVHVPLRPDTEGLVDEGMIRRLKRGTILINTARGKVIDETALIKALEDGHVSVYSFKPYVLVRLMAGSWVRLDWTYILTSPQSTHGSLNSQMPHFSRTWEPRHAIHKRRWKYGRSPISGIIW
jgi:lactate dehydrogenase-like 2-hydroxyacid dehydrogenase